MNIVKPRSKRIQWKAARKQGSGIPTPDLTIIQNFQGIDVPNNGQDSIVFVASDLTQIPYNWEFKIVSETGPFKVSKGQLPLNSVALDSLTVVGTANDMNDITIIVGVDDILPVGNSYNTHDQFDFSLKGNPNGTNNRDTSGTGFSVSMTMNAPTNLGGNSSAPSNIGGPWIFTNNWTLTNPGGPGGQYLLHNPVLGISLIGENTLLVQGDPSIDWLEWSPFSFIGSWSSGSFQFGVGWRGTMPVSNVDGTLFLLGILVN